MKFPGNDFYTAIHRYADHLESDYNKAGFTHSTYAVQFELGRKFIKVVSAHGDGHRSVHSFICLVPHGKFRYGDILKAAGWAKPAKNFARGTVLDTDSYKNHRWAGI